MHLHGEERPEHCEHRLKFGVEFKFNFQRLSFPVVVPMFNEGQREEET